MEEQEQNKKEEVDLDVLGISETEKQLDGEHLRITLWSPRARLLSSGCTALRLATTEGIVAKKVMKTPRNWMMT